MSDLFLNLLIQVNFSLLDIFSKMITHQRVALPILTVLFVIFAILPFLLLFFYFHIRNSLLLVLLFLIVNL